MFLNKKFLTHFNRNCQVLFFEKYFCHSFFRREGIKGYYKGLYPNLLKVVPQTCIIMTVIENVKKFLQNL